MKQKIITIALAIGFGLLGFTVANRFTVTRSSASAESVHAEVQLMGKRANPDTITVPVGETVRFRSADGQRHNLSLGEGGEDHEHKGPYSSGEFQKDEAWEVTFKEPGTYNFHDHYNPDINVLVVAYQSPANDNTMIK